MKRYMAASAIVRKNIGRIDLPTARRAVLAL
jgi:hypothetical protein